MLRGDLLQDVLTLSSQGLNSSYIVCTTPSIISWVICNLKGIHNLISLFVFMGSLYPTFHFSCLKITFRIGAHMHISFLPPPHTLCML